MQQSETTIKRRFIIQTLLEGGSIAKCGPGAYRLRDAQHNVVMKISQSQMYKLRPLLRTDKRTRLLVIDLRKVRAMNGHSLEKKMYKVNRKSKILNPNS